MPKSEDGLFVAYRADQDDAYEEREDLTAAVIAEGTKRVGYGAFYKCSNLRNIGVPQTVDYIDGYAFAYCESLMSVKLPDGLIGIGEGAFKGCGSLEDVAVPDGCLMLGSDAFSGCSALKSAKLP
ncbi:leucine-rich repeat domain-containing protein [bacterium]|nr:leucine-rich repeat domain-containing protein [bacterium]